MNSSKKAILERFEGSKNLQLHLTPETMLMLEEQIDQSESLSKPKVFVENKSPILNRTNTEQIDELSESFWD